MNEIVEIKNQIKDLYEFSKGINDSVNQIIPVVNALAARIDAIEDKVRLLEPMDILLINSLGYNNIGDFILSSAVEETIAHGTEKKVLFGNYPVNHEFGLSHVRAANNAKAIVVGGGGLIFRGGMINLTVGNLIALWRI